SPPAPPAPRRCNAAVTAERGLTRYVALSGATIQGAPGPLECHMNQATSLRRLLDELHAADVERQGEQRDTPAYTEAVHRVESLVEAVWRGAGGARAQAPPHRP